jgi:hypothetical protein
MSYTLSDPSLQAVVERRQTEQTLASVEKAWQPTRWYWIFSHHNIDLAVSAGLYFVTVVFAVVAVIVLLRGDTRFATAVQIIFSTAVFGTFIELIRRLYDTAVKRLATIDLFTSEIISILRIFAAANIIGDFICLHDKLRAQNTAGATPNNSASASGFADSARSENYFAIFEANSSDLGSLVPSAVNDITAFYTFLKASRDATGALKLWKEEYYDTSMKQDDVISIIYLCFLMAVHGRRALEALCSSPDNVKIINDIFAGVLLQCYRFLDLKLAKADYRRPRLKDREELCANLAKDFGYDWAQRADG